MKRVKIVQKGNKKVLRFQIQCRVRYGKVCEECVKEEQRETLDDCQISERGNEINHYKAFGLFLNLK